MQNEPAAPVRLASLKSWMIEDVLPFWASVGFNRRTGLFHERLSLDGAPDPSASLRLRVQFRQIYVYSHAQCLGWFGGGGELALKTLRRLRETAFRDGGFVHALRADGSVEDDRFDSYDHAFAVLALSWLLKATGDAAVRAMLDEVIAFVDARLTHADGALLEGEPHRLPRRQNPQMHWFEAMLALHHCTGRPDALIRAARIRTLFERQLFDRVTGNLREYFEDDWTPARGAAGASIEPGHQAEWVWLLRTHDRLAGFQASPDASRLLAAALRFRDPSSGLLVDEVDADGAVRRGTRRSWLQTELCKAQIAEFEAGLASRDAPIGALAALETHHLRKPFTAGWIDQLDERGAPVSIHVPASILYHVFTTVAEAERVLGPTEAAP
ncbi:MAG: AGE family epimerase/isomerase [Beijerinckiaceae bacterium]|nr:AGE family epimerase/isomerase [Beijerinckiaceae bacterium]